MIYFILYPNYRSFIAACLPSFVVKRFNVNSVIICCREIFTFGGTRLRIVGALHILSIREYKVHDKMEAMMNSYVYISGGHMSLQHDIIIKI